MTQLWLLRHAPTAWSVEKRLQGRQDMELNETGRRTAKKWRLPSQALHSRWFVSPLRRCLQTANLLGLSNVTIEPRLIEMDWGRWEGRTAAELAAAERHVLAQEEANGLDMRPPNGESPREVQSRVQTGLSECAGQEQTAAAITHKGVIRAVYALAADWDMRGPPPDRLDWHGVHRFVLAPDGKPRVDRLNLTLSPES